MLDEPGAEPPEIAAQGTPAEPEQRELAARDMRAAYKAIWKPAKRARAAPRPSVAASMPALEGAVLAMLETPRDFKLPRGLWHEHQQRARAEELRCGGRRSKEEAACEFTVIRRHVYVHRKERALDRDEISLCACVAPADGGMGCGEGCINRAQNLECSPHCALGSKCSNRQLQRHARSNPWARVCVRETGERGLGLFASKTIKEGQLVGEYLGEVLTEAAYTERQASFAAEKHKYFMNLGGGEVIDASRKAGPCRFCNHSCAPNAETQKWLVGGERDARTARSQSARRRRALCAPSLSLRILDAAHRRRAAHRDLRDGAHREGHRDHVRLPVPALRRADPLPVRRAQLPRHLRREQRRGKQRRAVRRQAQSRDPSVRARA